ncbi:MAG TPA: FKBP-type peptidyl-prolyl cis-trans isomerase, partial [Sphingomonadales bacterium]
ALLVGCGDDKTTTEDPAVEQTAGAAKTGETENGVRYEVIQPGKGQSPTLSDYVTVHFRVMRADGSLIDDSRREGAQTHLVSDTLLGWQEVLPKMQEGAVWRIHVPAELAFGEQGLGDIVAPNEPLAFEIELIDVMTQEEWQAARLEAFKAREAEREANRKFLKENAEKPGVTVTESGLQYEVLVEGGGARPKPEDRVQVHYRGMLIDGTEFDSSYKRGEPAEFPINRLIQGWQEGLTLMNEGAKWRLVVPAELGYGDRGAGELIKPGDTLIFEVELIRILG